MSHINDMWQATVLKKTLVSVTAASTLSARENLMINYNAVPAEYMQPGTLNGMESIWQRI